MLNNIGDSVIKKAKICYRENSLIVSLQFKNGNDRYQYKYLNFLNIYTEGMKKNSEKAVINLVESTTTKVICEYFIDDYDSNNYPIDQLNIISTKIDFRDPEFSWMFDGLFNITLTSCTNIVNDFNMQFAGGYELFDSLKNKKVDRILFILSMNYEDTPTVLEVTRNIRFYFPKLEDEEISIDTGDNKPKSDSEIINYEEKSDTKELSGYIYIAANKYMTVLKIGRSSDVDARMIQLSRSTSVPDKFQLVYKQEFYDVVKVERYIHRILQDKGLRVSNKEFFNIGVDDAISFIKSIDERKI